MIKHTIILLLIFCVNFAFAQNEAFLQKVLQHNTKIEQIRKADEARQLESRTGILPEGPEIEAGYFPGNDNVVKNTFGVSQRFDFPLVYKQKTSYSTALRRTSNAILQGQTLQILSNAQTVAIRFRYLKNQLKVLGRRLQHTNELLKAFEKMLEQGDANLLEVNKIKVSQLKISSEVDQKQQEITSMKAKLAQYTNSEAIDYESLNYPKNFTLQRDEFIKMAMERSPVLQYLEDMYKQQNLAIKLSKAQNWPKFMLGYEYEAADPERFSGIKAGISIPLWQQNNKVKTARAYAQSQQAEVTDAKSKLKMELGNQFNEYKRTSETYKKYQSTMQSLESISLLKKSLDLGHISLIEYLLELKFFYEAEDRMLQLEFEQAVLCNELKKYEYLEL